MPNSLNYFPYQLVLHIITIKAHKVGMPVFEKPQADHQNVTVQVTSPALKINHF